MGGKISGHEGRDLKQQAEDGKENQKFHEGVDSEGSTACTGEGNQVMESQENETVVTHSEGSTTCTGEGNQGSEGMEEGQGGT